ncbi:hypothetical protein GCK72_010846 [Caenorhabditis remanei]|uniref:JmjC domain-containing protein n=1 Tax=Caenorhabditis remanei TaxID=31234 RepID=A0A6A5H729_CAERE|nr:hypothetical protein GCK72_010846 [Caenorhabditis remanei]KAF1762584.1 hypothetical protein GCK72_010846 [Caenorhabditis remanei]
MDLRERLPKKPTTVPKEKKKKYRRKNGRPGPKRGPGFYINMKYRKKKAERLAQQADAQLAQQPAAPAPTPIVPVLQPLPATSPQAPQARKKKPGRKRGPDYFKNLMDRRRREAAKQAASQVAVAQLAQQSRAPALAPGKPGRPRGPNYVRNLKWRKKAGPTTPLPVVQLGLQPAAAIIPQPPPKRKSKKANAHKNRQLKLMEKKAATKPVYRENRQYQKRKAVVPAPRVTLDRAGSPDRADPPVAVDDRARSPAAADLPIDVEDREGSPSSAAPPTAFVDRDVSPNAADPPIVDPASLVVVENRAVSPNPVNPAEDGFDSVDEGSNDGGQLLPSGSSDARDEFVVYHSERPASPVNEESVSADVFSDVLDAPVCPGPSISTPAPRVEDRSETWNGDLPIAVEDLVGPSAAADPPGVVKDLVSSALVDPHDRDDNALPQSTVSPAVTSLAIKPESHSQDSNDEDITDVPGTSQFAVEDDHDTVCAIDGVDKMTTESIRSGDKEPFLHHLNRFQVASKPFMGVFAAGEEKAFTNQELTLHIHEDGHDFEEKLDGLRDIHLFKNRDGLQMVIPEELNLTTLMDFLPQIEVPVINSYTRGTEKMQLSEVARLINLPEGQREAPWNLLSFEMSHTDCRIARDFKEPLFVRENSIVNRLEERLKEELQIIENQLLEDQTLAEKKKLKEEKAAIRVQLKSMPKYQKFLLVTMANSYTDIHVDPSGTCVYYHVKEGRKIFYVAPPTERNLEIYKRYEGSNPPEKWIVEEIFDELQRVEIKKGYTAFIPAGYIHAVYTPEDSIVFGGNFLMDGHIDRHFEMTAVEEKALEFGHIEVDNTFPNFENVMWRYTDKVVNERLQKPNPHWKDAVAPLLLRENLDEAKKPNRKLGTKVWYSKTERIKIVGQLKRLHDDYTIRKMREDGATWEEEHEAGQPSKRRKLCRKE